MRCQPPWLRLLAVVPLALLFVAAACDSDEPERECIPGGQATGVDSFELGPGPNGPFVPLSNGDILDMVYGNQGSAMVQVRLRVTGPDVPGCLRQETRVTNAEGETTSFVGGTLITYVERDGTTTTATMFLPFSVEDEPADGDIVDIRTDVGEISVVRTVEIRRL